MSTASAPLARDRNRTPRRRRSLGVARSAFFGERTFGALEGVELRVDAAHDVTVQAGLDPARASEWLIALGGRWFDLDAAAPINGADIGAIDFDPYMIGHAIGRRLR